MIQSIKNHLRLWIQLGFTALSNGYIAGFIKGKIYTGPSKQLCLPGLNCYSCPGALGSCPIGSLQAVLGSRDYKMSYYVAGFLIAVGALIGRLVCGFLCPFGLVQDLLHKIPFPIKRKNLPGDKALRYLKYVILVVFVIWLPLFAVNVVGQGSPWFCKWICPSGTLLGGIPLVSANPGLQESIGFLFSWKIFLLIMILLLSVISYRPFCKYVCPLGAIYGLCNPWSLYHYEVDAAKCTRCNVCKHTCQMDIDIYQKPNSPEGIRCGECKKACPHHAISSGFAVREKQGKTAGQDQTF